MRGTAVALALLMLLPAAAPVASAGWFSTTVTLAPYHVGDTLRFVEHRVETKHGKTNDTADPALVQIGVPGDIVDGFGVARSTVPIRVDTYAKGNLTHSIVDHCLRGGNESVRTDILKGGPLGSWKGSAPGATVLGVPTGGGFEYAAKFTMQAYFGRGCEGVVPLARTTFASGDVMTLSTLFPGAVDDEKMDPASDPGVGESFHGRDAVRFRFDAKFLFPKATQTNHSGYIDVVFADGLPGYARLFGDLRDVTDDERETSELVLDGFTAGTGTALPPFTGAALPAKNPSARFVTLGGALDDSALAPAYPLADALSNLASDRNIGYSAWRSAHPNAVFTHLNYDRAGRNGPSEFPTQGGWYVEMGDAREIHAWYSSRSTTPTGPALPSAVQNTARLFVQDFDNGVMKGQKLPDELPAQIIDAGDAIEMAKAQGVEPSSIQNIDWRIFTIPGFPALPYYTISQVNTAGSNDGYQKGLLVGIDAEHGRASYVASSEREYRTTGGVLDASTPKSLGETSNAESFSALAGPGAGVGLGVAGATGLALLLLAIKFLLVPLFTRLRRDTLLDNPVRAQLFERVRREPGIHLAELVDIAAIGEGATRHHMEQLEKHHLVVVLRDEGLVRSADMSSREDEAAAGAPHRAKSGFVRYYAAGEVPPAQARREAALRGASMREVYEHYLARPNATLREAGAALNLSAPTVHRCKKKLEKAGLLPAAHEVEVMSAA